MIRSPYAKGGLGGILESVTAAMQQSPERSPGGGRSQFALPELSKGNQNRGLPSPTAGQVE